MDVNDMTDLTEYQATALLDDIGILDFILPTECLITDDNNGMWKIIASFFNFSMTVHMLYIGIFFNLLTIQLIYTLEITLKTRKELIFDKGFCYFDFLLNILNV